MDRSGGRRRPPLERIVKLLRALFLVLVSASSCEEAAGVSRHLLQWKLAPGNVFRIELKQLQTGEAAVDAPNTAPRALESRLEAHYDLSVIAEDRPGEFRLELTPVWLFLSGVVGAVRIDVEYREGQWIKETLEGETGIADPKQILAQFKRTLVRPVPGLARPYGFKAASADDPPLLSGLFRIFPALPRDPVAVESNWFEEAPLGTYINTTGTGTVQMKNTFVSFETAENTALATIATVVDHTMMEKGKTFRVRRSRNAKFDMSDGSYRSISDDFTLSGEGWNMRVLADVRVSRLRR